MFFLFLFCSEGLGEGYDGDIAFASSLETFGGGHNDPISVAFGGMPVYFRTCLVMLDVRVVHKLEMLDRIILGNSCLDGYDCFVAFFCLLCLNVVISTSLYL